MVATRKSSALAKASTPKKPQSVLKRFDCESVHYEFRIPIGLFNARRFSARTRIKTGERWSAVIRCKNPKNAYHVHFNGSVGDKYVRMTVSYWDGTSKPGPDEREPFAESIMQWISDLFKERPTRVTVHADFRKTFEAWRSRFNLPFKVTMAGREVTIDGVSLTLPPNPQRVLHAFMGKQDDKLAISLFAVRPMQFETFDIAQEIASFSEALNMVAEPL